MLTPVPPSKCQRAREAVSLRLDGELSELGSARLSVHLRECAACAAYAREVTAIAGRLRAAPLEQPGIAVALPARRRRRPGLQIAAAGAAAALAAVSSVALDHALRSSSRPAETTQSLASQSLQQDIINQHILAMERKLGPDVGRRVGRLTLL